MAARRPWGPPGLPNKSAGPGAQAPGPALSGRFAPCRRPPTASSRRGQRAARSGGAGAAGGLRPPARCRASPGSGPAAGPWPRCAAAPALPAYRKAAKPAGLRLAPGKAGKLPALPGPPPIRMVPSGWRHMPPAGSVDPLPPRTKNLPLPDIAPTPGPLPPICGRLPHRPRPCARLPACPCA